MKSDRHHGCGPPQLSTRMFVGILVIVAGLLMTFDNLGLVHAEEYIRFWPASLIGMGLLKLWQSREAGHAVGGLLFTVIGTWLLLEQAALVRVSFWDMWPTLLVFLGAFLVWQGFRGPRAEEAPSVDPTSTVRATAVLAGVARGNNSSSFAGGELTAVMGGCEIDLRQAAIDGEAVIDMFALWGGIEIRVPDDWTVVSMISPILGGIDDQTRPPKGATRHRLVLRGMVIMSGVEITN